MRKEETVSGPCVMGSLSPTNLSDQSEAMANDPTGTHFCQSASWNYLSGVNAGRLFINEVRKKSLTTKK